MINIFNELAADVTKLPDVAKKAATVFEQQLIKKITETAGTKVYRTTKTDPAVILLASQISNMEILLSEAGQSFSLSDIDFVSEFIFDNDYSPINPDINFDWERFAVKSITTDE